MSSYVNFAEYYDNLTNNVDYHKVSEFIDGLIKEYGNGGNLLLDDACGTGNLSFELANLGYDVVATDVSEQMLSEAVNKTVTFGNPTFLRQSMQELDLFGTIDAAVCTLDSINHLENKEAVQKAFDKVSLFMNEGGIFIFDVNTLFKHREVLGQNSFVYDTDEVYCIWQNCFNEEDNSVCISLDFFCQNEDGYYFRSDENFSEYYYSDEFILEALKKCKFNCIKKFDGYENKEVNSETQRIVYVCRKEI